MADPADNFAHEVWIHYYPNREPLKRFLERNKPSQINVSRAHWISVRMVEELRDDEPEEEENLELEDEETDEEGEERGEKKRRIAMLAEWNSLLENPSAKEITQSTLKKLAIKYRITSGKWLIFARSSKIDQIWFTIAKGVLDGKLGFSAKVSTKDDEKKHVICVYTEDFTDEADVRRVERAIRKLNINGYNMQYKADIYTLLNIYRDNDLGIRPCIYKPLVLSKDNANYDHSMSLGSFLEEYKPSKIRECELALIMVSTREHYEHTQSQSNLVEDEQHCIADIKDEWKALQESKVRDRKITPETLEELAVKHRITTGKWMIFAKCVEVDRLWSSIAELTVAGRLGYSATVNTKKSYGAKHVISVHTQDFRDGSDVHRVEKVLRRFYVHGFMQYKADVYTILDIKRVDNFWYPPFVYKSENVAHAQPLHAPESNPPRHPRRKYDFSQLKNFME